MLDIACETRTSPEGCLDMRLKALIFSKVVKTAPGNDDRYVFVYI